MALLAAVVIILIGALTFAVYFFALRKHDDRGVSAPAAVVSIQAGRLRPA